MSVRTALIVFLALAFGVSAAVGVNMLVKQNAFATETAPVVVAARDVPRGGILSAEDLSTSPYPKDLVPPGSVTKLEDAVGRVVINPLVKDEALIDRKLAAKNAKGGLASLIPAGMRAFTILTPNVASGVAGLVIPGNKVDVLLTLGNDNAGGGVTSTLLQDVEILAVDTHLDAPNESKLDRRTLQSVTLLVTPDQAAKLNLGQNRGTLHLSLRNPEDDRTASTRVATVNDLQFHQEKSWGEQLKDVIEAYAKARPQTESAAQPPTPPQPAPEQPAPTLEIRTLRGRYFGVVRLGAVDQGANER